MITAIVGIGIGILLVLVIWGSAVLLDTMSERKIDRDFKRKYGIDRRDSYGSGGTSGGSSSGDAASAAAVSAAISSNM